MAQQANLNTLVRALHKKAGREAVDEQRLWSAVQNALEPASLINFLAEALRTSAEDVEQALEANGFADVVMQARMSATGGAVAGEGVSSVDTMQSPFPALFSISATSPTTVSAALKENTDKLAAAIAGNAAADPFLNSYRGHVGEYYDGFMRDCAPLITDYIEKNFGADGPAYLLNVGIGANEQSNHLVARLHNAQPGSRCKWLIINSPRQLMNLPADATVDNTLFMEFSRSGKTEETVKVHELTPRNARRVVFANSGPLHELGQRDNNLLLTIPAEVSGRFGRDQTPILLAAMLAAGMDTASYWGLIQQATAAFDLSDPASLPMAMAKFLFLNQKTRGTNHIYLAADHDLLIMLADEFTQFWNEGVTKNDNDVTMSRYLGLPRDSHMNLEGILANHKTKMAVCLFGDTLVEGKRHPMIGESVDAIDPQHQGLCFGDEEKILAQSNKMRLAELMPVVEIMLHGAPSLAHSAVIGQLWADVTYCYSRLMNIDPGSNPEVKAVRERAAKLLAHSAKACEK